MLFGREKHETRRQSPIRQLLQQIEHYPGQPDDYLWRVQGYLSFARDCGLHESDIVDSCIDLAATLSPVAYFDADRRQKIYNWQAAQQAALAVRRKPRLIDMELDPVYFQAILQGRKTFEGRAYKPDSDKNYPDIRTGDTIRFQLSHRKAEFAADAAVRQLPPDAVMTCAVYDMHFAPTVHGMYQKPDQRFDGDAFQPMVNGPAEMIELQRAAVYHTFPGYHELIQEHGFLGIELRQPQLL